MKQPFLWCITALLVAAGSGTAERRPLAPEPRKTQRGEDAPNLRGSVWRPR